MARRAAVHCTNKKFGHAMIAAIARDIEHGSCEDVMEDLDSQALSCTGTYEGRSSESVPMRTSSQNRENAENNHEPMRNTKLPSVYAGVYLC